MKSLLKVLIVIFLLLSFCISIALYLVVDQQPSVDSMPAASVEDAKASFKIAKALQRNLLVHQAPFVLDVSEAEINGQLVLLNRAIPQIKSKATLKDTLNVVATLEIPNNPIGRYINIQGDVLPSDNGLVIDNLYFGSIALPETLTLSLGAMLLDKVSGQELGTESLNAIQAVAIKGKQLNVNIDAIPDLKERLALTKQRFKTTREFFPAFGNPDLVRYYYQALIQYDEYGPRNSKGSVTKPMQALFAVALQRNGDPVEENKAAILALAMFYGSERVGSFVGNVKTPQMESYIKRSHQLTFKRRNDLTRHFTISAALKIISEKDITNAIGEFKELLDARKGGSGFSFVDLAADRAGVKFAEALMNPNTARILQKVLSDGAEEGLIFPNIYGLPERISQQQFQSQYGNVESQSYKQLVARIDGCIAELPAYQLGNYSISREVNACKFR